MLQFPVWYSYALLAWALLTTARQSGGGMGAEVLGQEFSIFGRKFKLSSLPEALFAATLTAATVPLWSFVLATAFDVFLPLWAVILMTVVFFVWFYAMMQQGHGAVLGWGERDPEWTDAQFEDAKTRTQGLTPVVNWLARRLRIPYSNELGIRSKGYSRLFMAVKGFILLLPLGGLPGAFLWSASYEARLWLRHHGYTKIHPHAVGESLTGLSATTQVIIAWEVAKWLLKSN